MQKRNQNLIAYNIGCSSSVRRLKSGRSQELITTDLKRKANMESGMWPIQLVLLYQDATATIIILTPLKPDETHASVTNRLKLCFPDLNSIF